MLMPRISPQMYSLSSASNPSALHDLLTDDVELTGVIIPRWDNLKPGEKSRAEPVLVVHAAHVCSKKQHEVEVDPSMESNFEVRLELILAVENHLPTWTPYSLQSLQSTPLQV